MTGNASPSTFGGFSVVGGKVEVLVAEDQVERAFDVLKDVEPPEPLDEDEPDLGEKDLSVCTLCGEAVPLR